MLLREMFLMLLSSGLSQADDSDLCRWGFGGYGEPCGGLHFSANDQLWADAVANSNSTGTYTMPGYDVSKPWPGAPLSGWTLSKTAVDLSKLPGESKLREGITAVVASDVRIIAPESLYEPSKNESDHGKPVVNVHPDWVFCAWRWFDPPWVDIHEAAANDSDLAIPEDGSCARLLSEECINAVERQARTAYSFIDGRMGEYGVRHMCSGIKTPDECKGTRIEGPGSFLSTYGLPLEYLNGSTTWQGGYYLEDNSTVEDKQKMWKTSTESYQPVLTMFGRANNDTAAEVEPGFTKLSCIRALPAEGKNSSNSTGSDEGGDDTNGAAPFSSGSAVNLALFICMLFWSFM